MKIATIQILNHISSPAICTLRYIVEYKLEAQTTYTRFYPDPIIIEGDSFDLTGLESGTTYDVRIARVCCDAQTQSTFAEFQINT